MYTLKKSLGQHFLTDESVSQRIVKHLQEHPLKQLVEVGPGGGALTKYLLELEGVDMKFVEVDDEKVEWLEKTYPDIRGKIIHKSILDIEKPFEQPFTVVGNFPYNISTEIVFKVLEWRDDVDCMIGMFQKEVAERIASKEGSRVYGVTSVLVQAYYDVEYLFEVDENAFNPPPKVKSAVIRFLPRKKELIVKSERSLFVLVKAAFGQRRKTLRNAVKSLFDPEVLTEPLFSKRAEQLSVSEFAQLTFRMHTK